MNKTTKKITTKKTLTKKTTLKAKKISQPKNKPIKKLVDKKVLISVKNLSFNIKHKIILNDISLDIFKGDRIALVGGNGAGKTTLVETILGINHPNKGKIEFKYNFKISPLEMIGVQFQDNANPVNVTTRDILDFFATQTTRYNKKTMEGLIDKFAMRDFLDQDSMSLSGGQKQKLNTILSLINTPDIIFLDELTTGLDIPSKVNITKEVANYLKEDENRTMVLVTHNKDEITNLANRIVVLELGVLKYDAPLKDTLEKYKNLDNFLAKFVNVTE